MRQDISSTDMKLPVAPVSAFACDVDASGIDDVEGVNKALL
jgi:hypothetical protein